jgi:hypothetical protein
MKMPKEIKGIDVNPKGREPRQLGRMHGPGMQAPEIIRHGRYPDGQDRMGTAPGAEHTDARTNRHKDGEAYRAGLRDSKY